MDKASYSPKILVTTFKITRYQNPGAHNTNSQPNTKHKFFALNLYDQE